jgi:hypothetical protein
MGLLKKISEARETAAASQDPESGKIKAPKEKKPKKGFLDSIGVKKENPVTDEDRAQEHRHRVIEQIWVYLRRELDLGAQEFSTSGESPKLRTCLSPALYQRMSDHLGALRQEGKAWSYPSRSVQSHSKVRVVNEELNIKTKQPTQFTIAERFLDYSQLESQGQTQTADGPHREIEATIDVLTENNSPVYKIVSLVRINSE